MLKIEGLSAGYGETNIITDLNLEIPPGQIAALMGNNGVGKSTLLKTIMGILPAKTGIISFEGENITKAPSDVRAKGGLGYVPQGRDIFPFLTVKENLLIGLEARAVKRAVKKADLPDDIFQLFPALKDLLHRRGGDLSGGQQQQLAIARILITGPRLLILDEPTEGIQPSVCFQIENAIRFIKEQKSISVLLVEQYVDFALRLSDLFYVMEKGSLTYARVADDQSRAEVKNKLKM
ncbi:urea ABC transporter ATP-binding subunit UrtE [Candidatus Haliotispira prima]|uniref:Urea ABC transporter ATP-binding subunit UrtE n=1 Tax=Candidatus Haliotispira prima TaxID=3034016 RepID=A0ABY8MJA8_9SPIO|nr:urea ABC transporter ATP-binding subunit UrtE [Candidatus Haliotispira prima]